MARKVFEVVPPAEYDPPVFVLRVRRAPEAGPRPTDPADPAWRTVDEEFPCVARPPAGAAQDYFNSFVPGGREVRPIVRFLRGVVEPEHTARFELLIRDKDALVEALHLAEVCEWLLGEYLDRPTGPPSSPGDGRPTSATAEGSPSGPGSEASTSPTPS